MGPKKERNQGKESYMNVRPVNHTPAFKGLIYSENPNIAVNTQYITSMKEIDVRGKRHTEVKLVDRSSLVFDASLKQMLDAYNCVAASDYCYKIKDEANTFRLPKRPKPVPPGSLPE